MTRETKKYDANFTAGGLLHREFFSLKDILEEENFLDRLSEEVENNQILGISTESARKRVCSEIGRRYKSVNNEFWSWFVLLPESEKLLALFYLCLKSYRIVFDLQIEVAKKKYSTGDRLDAFSVTMRLDELASMYEEVASWSEATIDKINSQYRTTLKDCGLLEDEYLVKPNDIRESFWTYFNKMGDVWFKELCFN